MANQKNDENNASFLTPEQENVGMSLEYFTNHDWQGDYSWYQTETKEFINKCIEYLSADHPTEKGCVE